MVSIGEPDLGVVLVFGTEIARWLHWFHDYGPRALTVAALPRIRPEHPAEPDLAGELRASKLALLDDVPRAGERPECAGDVTPAGLTGTAQAPIMGRAMPRHATSQDGADRPRFVPIAEAARLLGVSPTTVKRRIRAGTLEAEQLQRPQGFEYRVRVQADGARDDAPPPTAPSLSEPATAHGTAHDTTHARCFDELAAGRQTIERQAEQLVGQAETIGRLRAERDAARAEVAALTAPQQPQDGPGAPEPTEPTTEPAPRTDPLPWPWPSHPPLRGATIGYADIVRAVAPWVLAVLAVLVGAGTMLWAR